MSARLIAVPAAGRGTFDPGPPPRPGASIGDVQFDRAGLRVLDREECLALLATAGLGRIAVSVQALPLILPVRFAMDDDRIVISTAPTSTLASATADTVVAFEADGATSASPLGWSVHVNGIARHVQDLPTCTRLAGLGLPSWSAGERPRFIAISTDQLTGRDAGGDLGPFTSASRRRIVDP